MSDLCHICGPVKREAPTLICAPCALEPRYAAWWYDHLRRKWFRISEYGTKVQIGYKVSNGKDRHLFLPEGEEPNGPPDWVMP